MLKQSSLTIRLHPADDVVIARQQLVGGTTLIDERVTVAGLVPPGHKVATRAIAAGSPVRRYNQIIGFVRREGANAGKVGTRNYIGILSTVNCSATVARGIADRFTRERLAALPNVDGV